MTNLTETSLSYLNQQFCTWNNENTIICSREHLNCKRNERGHLERRDQSCGGRRVPSLGPGYAHYFLSSVFHIFLYQLYKLFSSQGDAYIKEKRLENLKKLLQQIIFRDTSFYNKYSKYCFHSTKQKHMTMITAICETRIQLVHLNGMIT